MSKYNQIRNLQRLWTDSVLVLCIAFDYFSSLMLDWLTNLCSRSNLIASWTKLIIYTVYWKSNQVLPFLKTCLNIIETHAAILKSTHFFPILKETMAIHKKAQSYHQYFFNNVYFLIFNFNPTPVLQFLYNAKQKYDWRVILLTI